MQPTSRKLLFVRILLLALLAIAPALAVADTTEVVGIRFGVHSDRTRIVFDLSVDSKYRIVVVDGQTLHVELMGATVRAGAPVPKGKGLVRNIGAKAIENSKLRFVIALTRPGKVLASEMLDPAADGSARLYVDIIDIASSTTVPSEGSAASESAESTAASTAAIATGPTEAEKEALVEAILAANVKPSAGEATKAGGDAATDGGGIVAKSALPVPPQKPTDEATNQSPVDSGLQVAALSTVALPIMAITPPIKPESGTRTKKKPVIVIDPGHGGKDPGAIGTSGIYEKDVTLKMARELERLLEAEGRYDVVLTRSDDRKLPLRDRFEVARVNEAALFISLHADHNPLVNLRGVSVYTLSETASDAEAAALATRENKEDVIHGVSLANQSAVVTSILIDLAQRETKNLSVRFAGLLTKSLLDRTTVASNTHRFAGFAVLKAPDVPSVLIEIGYLSNEKDEKALQSKRHRTKIGEAIREAVDQFFSWQQGVRQS